ncbi:MAG: recombinase family protein [Rubrobacteraceae bacterium]
MPSTNGHGPKRAILYVRVSTEEQAKSGYSIPEQLRELRTYATREGYRVIEEAIDDGHSGADPYRPGLRRVMELAEGGAIDVVLAKKRNRLFRSRLYRLLWDQDLGELGVKLVALDDTGNRFGDAMQDEFAEWEREEIARRTQEGLLEKCRGGLVVKRKRAAYGYRASEDGNALEVSETEIEVVRRIFRAVAEGMSVRSVRLSLERDGIPAPSGIGRWNHTTIKNMLENDLYAPHTREEVARLVEPAVAALLDENGLYGLWTWNTRKTTRRKVWDEAAGEFKIRYSYAPRPREEWLFVPVPGAGITETVIEAARQSLKDNARKPSEADKRFWELSGAILRCGECGHTLRPHTIRKSSGKHLHYYACRSRYNTGPARDCSNNRHLRAERIEEQVWEFVRGLLKDPERIRVGLDRLIEEERRDAGRDPEHDAKFWSKKMTEAEVERRGYHRLAARGHMTDEELSGALSELDDIRETAERELEAARARSEALERLSRDRDALMEFYAGMVREALDDLASEERHHIYKLLRLGVRFRPNWPLEISGVFAEVAEEAEAGLSSCKLSPLSV